MRNLLLLFCQYFQKHINTFEDAVSPKAIELFQKFFHICFYCVKLFQNYNSIKRVLFLIQR